MQREARFDSDQLKMNEADWKDGAVRFRGERVVALITLRPFVHITTGVVSRWYTMTIVSYTMKNCVQMAYHTNVNGCVHSLG